MANKRHTIPSGIAAAYAWLDHFAVTLDGRFGEYGVTEQQKDRVLELFTTLQARQKVAENVNTRTKPAVTARNEAMKAMRAEAMRVVSIVNGQLDVTDAMRQELGLLIPDRTPTHREPPKLAPGLKVVVVDGNDVKLRLRDAGDPKRRGRPTNATGATIMSYVGEQPSADEAVWQFKGNTGEVEVTVPFPASLPAGTRVWVTAFWYARGGRTGPAATPVSAHLAGAQLRVPMAA